jgi:Holliday junction resolvase-like predicted endonuclease
MSLYKVGRAGEHLAAYYLLQYFDEIFEPNPQARYDYLAMKDDIPFKIQVKTSESPFQHRNKEMVRWDIKKRVNKTKKGYNENEVDIFAFCYLPFDKIEFQPNRNITATWQKDLNYIKEVDPRKSLERSITIINALKENAA